MRHLLARAEAELPLSAEEAWGLAKKAATQLYLSFERVDDRERELLVREQGGRYRVWDHRMRLEGGG